MGWGMGGLWMPHITPHFLPGYRGWPSTEDNSIFWTKTSMLWISVSLGLPRTQQQLLPCCHYGASTAVAVNKGRTSEFSRPPDSSFNGVEGLSPSPYWIRDWFWCRRLAGNQCDPGKALFNKMDWLWCVTIYTLKTWTVTEGLIYLHPPLHRFCCHVGQANLKLTSPLP